MITRNIERFIKEQNLTISPHDLLKNKEESYVKRKFSSKVYCFHDTNGIEHYVFKNKDYRRKILRVKIGFDKNGEYPSFRRVSNLKNIIKEYAHKNRILTEKTIKNNAMYEIKYEILFTANNTLKSYQYWIDELAYEINDNTIIFLEELSLDVSTNPIFKKIIPDIETNQFQNKNINPLKENLDKLDNYELATISKEYQKENVLPPYDLAVKLELGDEFFRENMEYYEEEINYQAKSFLDSVMHAKIIRE